MVFYYNDGKEVDCIFYCAMLQGFTTITACEHFCNVFTASPLTPFFNVGFGADSVAVVVVFTFSQRHILAYHIQEFCHIQ